MMRSKTQTADAGAILLFALALGLGAVQAQADGPSKVSIVEKPSFDWSGVYVGVHAGWGRLEVDRQYPVDDHYVISGTFINQEADGWIHGGHLGFNHQIGSLVAGAEILVSRADIETTGVFQGYPTDPPVRLTAKMDTLLTATVRLGVAHGPFLLFAKGGYAGAEIGTKSWDPVPHWSEVSRWTGGWTLGAGFEVSLYKNITWGVEYSYIDLDVDTHNGPVNLSSSQPAPPRYQNTVVDPDLQIVTTRLNFKFRP
jgi:outer membrane immunogenic protein